MEPERVYGPGTRFVVFGGNHPIFTKPFEVTDAYKDGSTFIKLRNPEGSAEPFERSAVRTTQREIAAQVANGMLAVEGEERIVPAGAAEADQNPAPTQPPGTGGQGAETSAANLTEGGGPVEAAGQNQTEGQGQAEGTGVVTETQTISAEEVGSVDDLIGVDTTKPEIPPLVAQGEGTVVNPEPVPEPVGEPAKG